MTKEEQLAAIKDGKSVLTTTDGNIEVQQTPIEKDNKKEEAAAPVQEESKEVTAEVPKEEPEATTTSEDSSKLEPDVKIGADLPSIEVPVDPVPTSSSEIDVTPAPEVPFTINVDGINVGNNADTTTPEVTAPAYEQPVQTNNFSFGGLSNDTSLDNFSGMSNATENEANQPQSKSDGINSVLEYVRKKKQKTRKNPEVQNYIIKSKEEFREFVTEVMNNNPLDEAIEIIIEVGGDNAEVGYATNIQLQSCDEKCASAKDHEINGVFKEVWERNISLDELFGKGVYKNDSSVQDYNSQFVDNNDIFNKADYNQQPINQFDNFSEANNGKIVQFSQNSNDMGSNSNSFAA